MNVQAALPLPPGLVPDEVLRAAALAPSPDNNQPWRFAWAGDRLRVYLDPARALPSDVNSMFDLAGVGAAVENAAIAARRQGFEAEAACELQAGTGAAVPVCAAEKGALPVRPAASVRFVPGALPDPLLPHLEARCTNRRLYSRRPVVPEALDELAGAAAGFRGVRLEWVVRRRAIRAFARVVAQSDRFRFQYEPFHREIFRQLRFTVEEAERTRDGLDVRTLELPPGAAFALRLLRPWKRVVWLHRLGLGWTLTFPSLLSVWMSGALGVLTVAAPDAAQFFEGGRAFQRVWIAAQGRGLAIQPLGSLAIFLAQRAQLGGRNLTPSHQRLAASLAGRLEDLIPSTQGRTLLMLFRLGYAPPPRVRSLRIPAPNLMVQVP